MTRKHKDRGDPDERLEQVDQAPGKWAAIRDIGVPIAISFPIAASYLPARELAGKDTDVYVNLVWPTSMAVLLALLALSAIRQRVLAKEVRRLRSRNRELESLVVSGKKKVKNKKRKRG